MHFSMMVALRNSRIPFSSEIAVKGNRRKHPTFADLSARECAGLRFEANGFGMRTEDCSCCEQVDGGRERSLAILSGGGTRSATHGMMVLL